MTETAIRSLVDGGFLPTGQYREADMERAIYVLFNAAKAVGVTCYDAQSPAPRQTMIRE